MSMHSPRLDTEWQRLYGMHDAGIASYPLTRALVLEWSGPGAWLRLSHSWQALQSAWNWPEPAIAVNGRDGYQLWLSFAQAEPVHHMQARARAVQDWLAQQVDSPRPTMVWPAAATDPGPRPLPHAHPDGRWSAFVAPDLAPIFQDEPWLDIPPSPEGQADLLCRLSHIPETAVPSLLRTETPPAVMANPSATVPVDNPREFLRQVMNDPTVAMRWRIEAAKALLPLA